MSLDTKVKMITLYKDMEVYLPHNTAPLNGIAFTLTENIIIDYQTGSITLELRSNVVGPTTYQGRLDPAELDRVMEGQDPDYKHDLPRVFLDNSPAVVGPDNDRVPTYCDGPGHRVQLEFMSVKKLITQNEFMQEFNDSIRNGNYFYQLGEYKYPISFKDPLSCKDLFVSYPGGRLDSDRLVSFIKSFIPDPCRGVHYEMKFAS